MPFFSKVTAATLRIPKSVVIPMYEGMTHLIGEDLLVELAVPSLAPPVITHMELLEVLTFRNKIFNLFVIKDIVLITVQHIAKKVPRIKTGSVDNFTPCCRTLHVHGVQCPSAARGQSLVGQSRLPLYDRLMPTILLPYVWYQYWNSQCVSTGEVVICL